ncbi:uncharacterized protein OCT59_000936 [Rhizophagus irregularis]|uniref:uncharacterized protein n=1 Tax=Rhizophagus irregularis TaxID=588596 RepID=UPI001D53402E|nr:hypothetical protein OCT59_000936 [Rhizophagus irregularis]CAG8647001.1 5903_t:CDS:2 [Rhizophagus irregularis]
MTRGYSLEKDLRLLINNPKYSDIEILCEDEKKLYGCRAILAARSEVFDRLLYNGMKESYETQISFPKINSTGMEIVLEYTYTGSIKNESLTKDNIIEAFYAADYFQLPDLQDFIMKVFKNIYSSILAAKQVSNDAFNTLLKRLPTLDQIENSIQVESEPITDHQKVAKELEPLIEFINFRRIQGQVLVDIIEPLEIVPAKIILNVYRHNTKSINSNINHIRGISISNCSSYVWDETSCGSRLIIEDNGKVVYAPNGLGPWKSVRAKMSLENNGIFEWDVIIEKVCVWSWVGVCASENFNYGEFAGVQPSGWVLGSNGSCCNPGNSLNNYCPPFHNDGAKITVHLDMNRRTCSFTVNGTKYSEVSAWNNLPSKLYPVVSLYSPGRFRIQPHQD